jgi:FHA domain
MAQTGSNNSPKRLGGQTIVDELIRNMEAGRLEMAYSVLLPCLFSVYLHPDDYARLSSVQELIRDDARRALSARMAEWNAAKQGKSLLHRATTRKEFRIAQNDWWIELFPDTEGSVPPGDVEIHSELNDVAQPGYRGAKTTLIDREPSVPQEVVVRDRRSTRLNTGRVFAEIRYKDDSGPQTFFVTQNEISIGRGGEDQWVDLPLYSSDEVSREHARLRRDPSSGAFILLDNSRNGTWLNGRKLSRGVEEKLPDRAEIGIAEAVRLSFEARK